MKLNNILQIIRLASKEVFTKKKYIIIALLLFTVTLFSFNAVITNISLLINIFSFELLFGLILGITHSMTYFNISLIILLSVLGGIVFSMTIYLIRRQIQFNKTMGTTGLITSVIAPSCPSCALGILSIIGVGGVLATLPLKGIEISIVSFLLLLWTIYYLSKKITTTTCKV